MTREEIERAILAGAEKRAARQAKREALRKMNAEQAEEPLNLPADFEEQLKSAWDQLERLHNRRGAPSPELTEQVKALFLPEAEDAFRFRVYRKYFHDYETLIFYAWIASGELCDAAFKFWDNVLQNPDALFSGNSIIRILGGRPNENLLKMIQNHREQIVGEGSGYRRVFSDLINRYLSEPGLWNFATRSFDEWTQRELEILQEIKKLL